MAVLDTKRLPIERPLARAATLLAELFGEGRGLSPRERQVIALTLRGMTTKEIEFELGCSRKTIEQYWYRIYAKLGSHGREQVMIALLFWIVEHEQESARVQLQSCLECPSAPAPQ